MPNALWDVGAERQRQIEVEGWTSERDDKHRDGELALAAAAYAYVAADPVVYAVDARRRSPAWWPWDDRWWKPKNRRRDLVRAAALLVAEIERIDRADTKEPPR